MAFKRLKKALGLDNDQKVNVHNNVTVNPIITQAPTASAKANATSATIEVSEADDAAKIAEKKAMDIADSWANSF